MYYYYVYITMIVYFLTDVMKWLRGKWNQLMKLVIPVWSSIGQDFCVPSMHNREFKFGYQHFLLCQKSFLKVSSKWLLKNKSDNGKLLLGKTYSGERFRAILALLFQINFIINYFIIPPLCRRGVYCLALSVLGSVTNIFCCTFLNNHASHPLQTWCCALARGPTFRLANSDPPLLNFLFPGLVHF